MKIIGIKVIQNETEGGDAYVTEEFFEIRESESVKAFIERALPNGGNNRPDWHFSEVHFKLKICR